MEESLETGRTRPLTTDDFRKALRKLRPSARAWFETARNYAMFANEGGQYDELLAYIKAKPKRWRSACWPRRLTSPRPSRNSHCWPFARSAGATPKTASGRA